MNANDLTDDVLMHFYEGNIEVRSYAEPNIYHGTIDLIYNENGLLKIEYDWLAKGEKFPPRPDWWEVVKISEQLLNHHNYRLSNPGDGNLFLKHKRKNETVIISPKYVNRIHPLTVKGLGI